ncbi:hypothetical protein ACS0PU_004825 [Formica fusca]
MTDCTSRWPSREVRKEKRILEQETRSGAVSFLTPHIRKRRSVNNFLQKTMPAPTPLPTSFQQMKTRFCHP